MGLTKRVELLFEPRQYALLEQIAKREKESVAALIRSGVEKVYLLDAEQERRAAFKRLASEEIDFGSWEEVKQQILLGYTEDLEEELRRQPPT